MKCRHCGLKKPVIKRGRRQNIQRYYCKKCKLFQQKRYTYKLYDKKDDKTIIALNAECMGISSMSRYLGYSNATIIRQIKRLAASVKRPSRLEYKQTYEMDELCTYIGKNDPEHRVYIIYAINQKTRELVDFTIGTRKLEELKQVVDKITLQTPEKVITDKLRGYKGLIYPFLHDTTRYNNNRIERCNLNLRTHIKRLVRKTICYSKSMEMLEATLLLYFYWISWRPYRYN